jgi:hypothetical protein
MTWLNRRADSRETAIQEWSDQESTVHSVMAKLSGSKKPKEQQATQFNLTLGQQNEQGVKLPATLARARSSEPPGFGQTRDDSVIPWRIIFSQKRRYNEEQLYFCHIFSCYSYTGHDFLRSRLVNLPTLQTIHRHFRSRLKEYEDKLTKANELPVYLDRMVQQHPLLSSGVCSAIDANSYSSTFLNTYEAKESDDSYMFLVNLQPLHLDAKCQPPFSVSSKMGNGSDIQRLFDQLVTKVQM